MEIVKATKLTKEYGVGEQKVTALNKATFSIKTGEFVAIVGTSGSGKSTLLHLIGGLDNATSGCVEIDGHQLSTLSEEALTVFRRRYIGFVFQSFNLVPILSVYENIVLPTQLDGVAVDENYVAHVLNVLGLKGKENRFPSQLSGGQQQRVAIARALASKPALILADEPTGNLDSQTRQEVLGLLKMSSELFNQTIVMITHDESVASLADRVLRIEDGQLMSV